MALKVKNDKKAEERRQRHELNMDTVSLRSFFSLV